MHISRLHIENFRSIRSLDIDLSETTIFIGPNNAGKTAILDAVRIVLTRRWGQRGTGFTENDVHRPDPVGDPRTLPPIRIVLVMQEPQPGAWDPDIAGAGASRWGRTAILGRTRAILQPVLDALRKEGVTAFIATRRNRFVSPQFIWLQSCLDQLVRPADRQIFIAMAGAANRITGTELDAAILAAEAESSGASYLEYWALAAKNCNNEAASRLSEVVSDSWWKLVFSVAPDHDGCSIRRRGQLAA